MQNRRKIRRIKRKILDKKVRAAVIRSNMDRNEERKPLSDLGKIEKYNRRVELSDELFDVENQISDLERTKTLLIYPSLRHTSFYTSPA